MKYQGFLWGCMFASIVFNFILMRKMVFLENMVEEIAKNCLRLANLISNIKDEKNDRNS